MSPLLVADKFYGIKCLRFGRFPSREAGDDPVAGSHHSPANPDSENVEVLRLPSSGSLRMTASRRYQHGCSSEWDRGFKFYRQGCGDQRDLVKRYFPRKRRIRRKTLAYIAGVTLPVAVFCWLGW